MGLGGGGRRLAGGGREPLEGAEELGTADEYYGKEGRHPRGLRDVFKVVVQAVLLFKSETWVLTPHGTGPGKIPSLGCKADNRESDKATEVGGLGVPTSGGSNEEASFEEMGAYVLKRQNTVAQ